MNDETILVVGNYDIEKSKKYEGGVGAGRKDNCPFFCSNAEEEKTMPHSLCHDVVKSNVEEENTMRHSLCHDVMKSNNAEEEKTMRHSHSVILQLWFESISKENNPNLSANCGQVTLDITLMRCIKLLVKKHLCDRTALVADRIRTAAVTGKQRSEPPF
eukprot:scaffold39440_cov63-Cyclotella_meneghiniana.AAC.6